MTYRFFFVLAEGERLPDPRERVEGARDLEERGFPVFEVTRKSDFTSFSLRVRKSPGFRVSSRSGPMAVRRSR